MLSATTALKTEVNGIKKNGKELVAKYIKKFKEENPGYYEFLEILAYHESRADGYSAHRAGSQYLGRYQIGDSTFEQIGFRDENGN